MFFANVDLALNIVRIYNCSCLQEDHLWLNCAVVKSVFLSSDSYMEESRYSQRIFSVIGKSEIIAFNVSKKLAAQVPSTKKKDK